MIQQQHFNSRLIILLIIFVIISSFVAMDLYLPSLPSMSRYFHISEGQAQNTINIYLLSFATAQFIYGPLSDHWGRRPLLLIGTAIYIIGSMICLLTPSFSLFLLGRFIQGAGTSAGATLSRVMIRDVFSGHKMAQASSSIATGVSMSIALAPAAGGLIQQYFGFRMNFLAMFLLSIMVAVLIYFLLPETNLFRKIKTFSYRHIFENYIHLLKSKVFLFYSLCSGFAFASMISFAITNPFLIQVGLGYSPQNYGLFTLLTASGFLLGAQLNVRLVVILPRLLLMRLSILLLLSAGLLLLIAHALGWFNIYMIVIPCFLTSMGMASLFPNLFSCAFDPFPHIAGTAGALFGGMQVLVSTAVSSLLTLWGNHSLLGLGLPFVVFAIIQYLLVYLANYFHRELQPIHEHE